MSRAKSLIIRTRRFRRTLTVVLLLGGLAMATGSFGQEAPPSEEPAATDQGTTPDPATPEPTDAAAKEAPAAPAPAAAPVDGVLSRLQADAESLVLELTKHVSSTPYPSDATVDSKSLELATPDFQKTLGDASSAGKYIHNLRKKWFVPAKSIHWVKEVELEPSKEEDAKLERAFLGFVTLTDGRTRAIKAIAQESGGTWKLSGLDKPSVAEMDGNSNAEALLKKIGAGQHEEVYNQNGHALLKENRTSAEFKTHLDAIGVLNPAKYIWGDSTAVEGGVRINGSAEAADGTLFPFYFIFMEGGQGLELLDVQSSAGMMQRMSLNQASTLDYVLLIFAIALILSFIAILIFYFRGLKGSPYEIYLLFFTKVTEYSAYGAAQLAFMFYLREDIGMTDVEAGSYYSGWSITVTLVTMGVGAICDAIGIKKTLLIGSFALLFSRAVMPFADNFWLATLCGFLPLGFGIAITGPVLSVGIKRFTTIEGAALGFGMFYTLMNVGWAVGAWLFDYMRVNIGESTSFMGYEMSVWQAMFGIGFFINVPDLIAILMMREGVEMTEKGIVHHKKEKTGEGMMGGLKTGIKDTIRIFGSNFAERAFWIFILLIGITVFARLTFFHFHITWPSYGVRYFGEGSLIGNIFGVLNPIMIVFLVPVIALFTRKVRSYWMLLIGTIISVASVVFVIIPPESYAGLVDTWYGTFVFDRWLEVPVGFRDPYYLAMVTFVIAFTVGEAIWSPRLMQFTAEIAPPGREGSYIALAYLPFFGAKFIAGPMAGLLLSSYSPEFGVDGEYMNYPDHQMIWIWVGAMAALTPIGLIGFKKLYRAAEERAAEAALAAAGTTDAGVEVEIPDTSEAPATTEEVVESGADPAEESEEEEPPTEA